MHTSKFRQEAQKYENLLRCFQSKINQPIDIAIIGDSHAEHLFIGLAEALPLKNIVYYEKDTLPITSNFQFDHIFEYLITDKNIKTIILNAHWNMRKKETPKNSSLNQEITKTINYLLTNKKNILLINDIPIFSFDPKQCKYIRPLSSKNNCLESKENFLKKYTAYSDVFENLKQNKKMKFLNTLDLFRDGENFSMEKNGLILYRDNQHLNIPGSQYIGKIVKLMPEIKK